MAKLTNACAIAELMNLHRIQACGHTKRRDLQLVRNVAAVLFLPILLTTLPNASAFAQASNSLQTTRVPLSAETMKKLNDLEKTLKISLGRGDTSSAAKIANTIGVVHLNASDWTVALVYFTQALSLARQIRDVRVEAIVLENMGGATRLLGDNKRAIEYDMEALNLTSQLTAGTPSDVKQNKPVYTTMAGILNNLGGLYFSIQQTQQALNTYARSLELSRQIGDSKLEAHALGGMALVYSSQGDIGKALEYFNQSLTVTNRIGDDRGTSSTLINIGAVYLILGKYHDAIRYFEQSIQIKEKIDDPFGRANALANIGVAYYKLGDPQKALKYYEEVELIYRQLGEKDYQAIALSNLGYANSKLGDDKKALQYYNQALPLLRETGDRAGEANCLTAAGISYSQMGNGQEALKYYNQALPLATATDNPLLEAKLFDSLLVSYKTERPLLAIYYGKQSVSLLQNVRNNIQSFDKGLSSSFLSSNTDNYHNLADLLVAQGRLSEAQQVLDMLKDQEYSGYVRGEIAKTFNPSLTSAERQGTQDYERSAAQLVSLGQQWSELQKTTSRTPQQESQFKQLSDQLSQASQSMNTYYSRMYELFGKDSNANRQVADVKGSAALLKQQIAKMPNTVALYTIVAKDRYSVIVVTGPTMVAREYSIVEKDLDQKVDALSKVLRSPDHDPRPELQELYKILIGPVKGDLDQAHAQTLVWVLDGKLRYVPMAALYDGKQYLVENYNNVTVTTSSMAHLADKPDVAKMSMIAMGISNKYEDDLPELPGVAQELNDIVKDPKEKNTHGFLPGTVLLNGQFTEKAMENQLGNRPPIVHIASHFVFSSGDDSESYLLLAGKDTDSKGFHLTVADFRDNPNLNLSDTALLTLSACETGVVSNTSDGREVDGLGTTAQLKGARAVLSSLWEVDDSSTGKLMADFYQRWSGGGGTLEKVEALRQAQLDLLQGKGKSKPDLRNRYGPTSYAHPYYWAPFVLMGNWQ